MLHILPLLELNLNAIDDRSNLRNSVLSHSVTNDKC